MCMCVNTILQFLFFFGAFLDQFSNRTRFTFKYSITLQTNAFITRDQRVLCWRQILGAGEEHISYWTLALLALETSTFHAGDEHFNAL